MRFQVRVELLSPLAISRNHATGNTIHTLRHVPGTVWRGALAGHLIRSRKITTPEADPVFRKLFLEGRVRFGDLRPAGSLRWPLSARRCKNHGIAHPLLDYLLLLGKGGATPHECAACEGKLERAAGFRQRDRGVKIPARMTGHTAIDPSTLRPRTGQLFQSEVLERGLAFDGWLWADEQAAEEFGAYYAVDRFTLGRGATRGQGHARLDIGRVEAAPAGLPDRISAMNLAWDRRDEVVFSCTFQSPCVVLDEWLLARSYPTVADLREACGAADTQAFAKYELIAQYSQWTSIPGWNAQAGLPRPETQAIAPGSSYLFRKKVEASNKESEISAIASTLARAERGLGERWEEGFGEAVFCESYHVDRRIK